MDKPSCYDCWFFEAFKSKKNGDFAGLCRRHPPQFLAPMLHALANYQTPVDSDAAEVWEQMLDCASDQTNWRFAVVDPAAGDWCGEFKPKV